MGTDTLPPASLRLGKRGYLTAEYPGKTSDVQRWMHILLGYLNQVKVTGFSSPLLDLNTIYLIFHQGLIMPRYYKRDCITAFLPRLCTTLY